MDRTFSKTEKLNWVLKYLIRKLNPEIVSSHVFYYTAKYGAKPKTIPLVYWNNHCDTSNVPEDIPYPFEGVFTLITKQFITIIGDDFEYRFPVNLLLTLWERFDSTFNSNEE